MCLNRKTRIISKEIIYDRRWEWEMSKLYIVMYHYIRNLSYSRYPAIKGLDYKYFKQQIDFFEENFKVVTMEEVLEAVAGDRCLPENAMLLTFDDGYIDHYTYALPILKEHHMQGAFFIPGKTFAEDVLLDVNKVHFILASSREEDLYARLLQQMDYYRGREFSYPSNEELIEKYENGGGGGEI